MVNTVPSTDAGFQTGGWLTPTTESPPKENEEVPDKDAADLAKLAPRAANVAPENVASAVSIPIPIAGTNETEEDATIARRAFRGPIEKKGKFGIALLSAPASIECEARPGGQSWLH